MWDTKRGTDMKVRKFFGLLIIAAIGFYFTGCYDVNSEFKNIRNHLLRGVKDSFEKDQEFALGGTSLSLARMFMKDSVNAGENKLLIESISELQIGTYKRKNIGSSLDFEQFSKLCKIMESGGWLKIVKNHNKNDVSAIFLKPTKNQQLERMFIMSMNQNELALTEIKGELDNLFGIVLRDKVLKVDRTKE